MIHALHAESPPYGGASPSHTRRVSLTPSIVSSPKNLPNCDFNRASQYHTDVSTVKFLGMSDTPRLNRQGSLSPLVVGSPGIGSPIPGRAQDESGSMSFMVESKEVSGTVASPEGALGFCSCFRCQRDGLDFISFVEDNTVAAHVPACWCVVLLLWVWPVSRVSCLSAGLLISGYVVALLSRLSLGRISSGGWSVFALKRRKQRIAILSCSRKCAPLSLETASDTLTGFTTST